jgi:hypothetical protein
MGRTYKAGVCALALVALSASGVAAKHRLASNCAQPNEVSAIQTASIQQELMVAALTCNQIDNFNAFQTNFGPELRNSDHDLLRMFTRLYGGGRGQAEYHSFKTRLANNSEMRSIRGNRDFCVAAGLVFSAALAPAKPSLSDFVSGVQVEDASPVNSCQISVALSLQGAMAAPNVAPKPKPAEFSDTSAAAVAGGAPAAAVPQASPQ